MEEVLFLLRVTTKDPFSTHALIFSLFQEISEMPEMKRPRTCGACWKGYHTGDADT